MPSCTKIAGAVSIALALVVVNGSVAAECVRKGSPNSRIDRCTAVIQSKPAKAELIAAHVIRGEAFARKGMDKEASSDFTLVLKVDPGHKQALVGRGRTLLAQRNYEAAIADLSLAIKRAPESPSILITRGYAFLAKNDLKLALDDFSRALERDSNNVLALNNRGLTYKKLGKPSLALADFTKALELNPLYALAYANRGYTYEMIGKNQAAIQDFERPLTVDPTLANVQRRLKELGRASGFASRSANQIGEGRAIAQKNCAWCHAIGPTGKSANPAAPEFRDLQDRYPILSLRSPVSRAIATPHDAMPKFRLKKQDVDRLIAYINSLSN